MKLSLFLFAAIFAAMFLSRVGDSAPASVAATAQVVNATPPSTKTALPRDAGRNGEHRPLDQGGDNIATATPIPLLPFNDVGQTVGFQNDYYEPCQLGGPDLAPDVVYSYLSPQPQVVDISLCAGTTFDSRLYVYQNTWTPGAPYACNDDFCAAGVSQISNLPLSPGNTYFIVVDGFVSAMGTYVILITPHPPQNCPCPHPEQEPNDNFPVVQSINLGEDFCGMISSPGDVDLVRLNQTVPSAIQLTLLGNAGPGPCPGGQGLHPSALILSEDNGSVIAYAGDTTNQATTFTSNFELGGYSHIIKIAGARGTTGPYVLRVDPIPTPFAPPPTPLATLNKSGGVTRLRWNGSYLPGEGITIESAPTPDGPWTTYAVVFGGPPSFPIATTNDREFFRLKASGNRPQSPFVGSVIPLSEPGPGPFDDTEVGQFQVQEIEWGSDPQGNVGMMRLLAQGIGPSAGQYIDQDNRGLFQNGYTPLTNFAGTHLSVFGREIVVEHVAFVRDPITGTLGIADGRGHTPAGDTTMYFSDSPQYLTPNLGFTGNWLGFIWFDWCPGFCCRLKTVAFCRATMLAWNAACVGAACPGNPACYLGCPCPPADPLCVVGPPGCAACDLVPDSTVGNRIWCMCPTQSQPPPVFRCFFQIWVKCKSYECQSGFLQCFCTSDPCPGPAVWTLVPFVNSAMRAACAADCDF
jgi:hypothetical protein